MKPIEFTKSMKILSMSYDKDLTQETIEMWYQHFKDIKKPIFEKAVQEAIITKKYMPSIYELLEICNKKQSELKLSVLNEMENKGYFKTAKEYEKAVKWLEKDITPDWLLKDMQSNYLEMNRKLIGN